MIRSLRFKGLLRVEETEKTSLKKAIKKSSIQGEKKMMINTTFKFLRITVDRKSVAQV